MKKGVSDTGKVIVITSGKGGTGKTTTTAAISSCLAALGHKTLAVDFDAGLRNLDISIGMCDFAVTDISDVLSGETELAEAAREHPLIPNLFFLSAPETPLPENEDMPSAGRFFDAAREEFEYTIVDSPAGLGAGFQLAAGSADTAVVVTTCDLSSVRDASKTIETLYAMGFSECRLLINRTSGRGWRSMRTNIDDIIDNAGARLLGVIREDFTVPEAAAADTPLILYSVRGAVYDFLGAARRLLGENVPVT